MYFAACLPILVYFALPSSRTTIVTMSATNKKLKASSSLSWEVEFDSVRDHIAAHSLGPEHPAIVAALKGIEQERKRVERDHKLKLKFTSSELSAVVNTNNTAMVGGGDNGFSKVGNEPCVRELMAQQKHPTYSTSAKIKSSISTDETMADDWEDVSPHGDTSPVEGSSKCGLGTALAKGTVELLGQNNVVCASPIGAIAVALHATLLQVGFVCTGVPAEDKTQSNGFAAPVRQLATFLPRNWERHNQADGTSISLRYRKNNAVTLKVESSTTAEQQLSIFFCENAMSMDVADHFNLDSWNRAQKPAPPSLHYKGLGDLLTKFTSQFDLGLLEEDGARSSATPQMQVSCSVSERTGVDRGNNPEHFPRRAPQQQFPAHPANVFPGHHPFGDFSGDLTPAGLVHPLVGAGTGSSFLPSPHPGNLMGPDHPMFAGGGLQHQQQRFKPRFDPFGPPGGPMDPSNNKSPPGGTGNPNNDMAIPTQFDPSNMFT